MGTPEFSVPILKSIYENSFSIEAVYTQPPQKSQRGQKVNKSPINDLADKAKNAALSKEDNLYKDVLFNGEDN